MRLLGFGTMLPLLVCVALWSCRGPAAKVDPKGFVEVLEPNDSADYKHIKSDFFRNKKGKLCERKLVLARPYDSACRCEFKVFYDTGFYLSSSSREIPLDSVIDINTFVDIGSTDYSKDARHVYYFFGNSDGGNRVIIEKADAPTFRRLCEYRWGIDKNFVYYQTRPLPGLDLKQLQVLYPTDTSDHFIEYVKDDKLVFCDDLVINAADAASFRVVSGKAWTAQDTNYRYKDGGRVGKRQ